MMKKIHTAITFVAGLSSAMFAKIAYAADPVKIPDSVPDGPSVEGIASSAVNILIFVAATASVIVIIVGGIMYATSAGDPNRTKTAKDAILYAIIGLVISLLAFAIVNFVLARI